MLKEKDFFFLAAQSGTCFLAFLSNVEQLIPEFVQSNLIVGRFHAKYNMLELLLCSIWVPSE